MAEQTQATMGALPPPAGTVPNFVDPPSLQGGVIAVLVVALTVTTLCIGLRVASRLADRFTNAGWDDCKSFKIDFTPIMSNPLDCLLLTILTDTAFFAWVSQ